MLNRTHLLVIGALLVAICLAFYAGKNSRIHDEYNANSLSEPVSEQVDETESNRLVAFYELENLTEPSDDYSSYFFHIGEIESLYGEKFDSYYYFPAWVDESSDIEYTPSVEVMLNNEYTTFTGTVFADEHMLEDDHVEFRVYKDNSKIFSTGMITRRDQPIDFSLDVTGAYSLKIEAYSPVNAHFLDANPGVVAVDLYVY